MTHDRPRAEFRHPWRLLALAVAGWALLFAWAFAQDADADDHGIVVTCATVQVWDHSRLGDVLVEYADGTDAEGRFGNAATFANDGPHGRVVRVVTDHHTYTVPAPSGCAVPPSTVPATTSTVAATTTTAPLGETQPSVPPTITPPPPPEGPPASTPTAQTGDPSVASTTVPPARPATPTVASPSFTG